MNSLSFEAIQAGIEICHNDGELRELRHIRDGVARSVFFRDSSDAARRIYRLSCELNTTDNFYVTLNPIIAAELPNIEKATCDRHIESRTHFFVDFDRRNRKIDGQKVSATDEELRVVEDCARRTAKLLIERFGWPEPIVIMSGNGFHLIFKIDLPNDTASKLLISNVLKGIKGLCETPEVEIDQGVANASRVAKVPGTYARKGANTPDRPHRIARIVSRPSEPSLVSLAQLYEVAALVQKTGRLSSSVPPNGIARGKDTGSNHRFSSWTRESFIQLLDSTGIPYKDPVPYEGGEKFVLLRCPFGEHRKITAAVFSGPMAGLGSIVKSRPVAITTRGNIFTRFTGLRSPGLGGGSTPEMRSRPRHRRVTGRRLLWLPH